MKHKKRLTRKQKREMNPTGSGNSKYALKIAQRAKIARGIGLPADTPYPVIWANR